jgi:conjugal transfer pilus assembly protein TraF
VTMRVRAVIAAALASLAAAFALAAAPNAATSSVNRSDAEEKRGYWWKKEPPTPMSEEEAHRDLGPPPSEETLLAMHPQEVEKLVEEYREFAIWKMNEDTVRWYFQMQDFARRRARAFMNVTELVMLQNPELNMQTVYPTNPAGQQARAVQRAGSREGRIHKERERAALVMLTRQGCGYCDAQRGVLQHFQSKFGWEIVEVDVEAQPQMAAKFAAETTPTTVVIFRDSPAWQPVALGVETLEGLEDGVYRALRFVSGEVQADQYTLQEFQDGGLYDPTRRQQ